MPADLTLRSSGSSGSVATWTPVKEAAELVAALLGEVAQLPAFLAGPPIQAPQGALRPRQVQQALVVVHRTRAVEPARCLYRLCCRLRASATFLDAPVVHGAGRVGQHTAPKKLQSMRLRNFRCMRLPSMSEVIVTASRKRSLP